MKIGFLITYFYPVIGGAENHCLALAKELVKMGHEVHVFTSGDKDSEEVFSGIRIHRAREIARIKYYLGFYPSIVKKALSQDLDVLHVHGLGFPQHDYLIRKLKKKNSKIKLICTPHGPFMALKNYNYVLRLLKSWYVYSVKKTLKLFDFVVAVNPIQQSWMMKDYGIDKERILFIPNGISKEFFKGINNSDVLELKDKRKSANKFIISYAGRIQKYKGLDQVIKVLPEISRYIKNIHFLAIGKDAGDKERLLKLARELNIEEMVSFTGEVNERSYKTLLLSSEIFVFPSEWEAFGIAMLEAMYSGNAVVSTKTEGGNYLISPGKNGYLYNYGDIKELKINLLKLIKNKEIRCKMQKENIKKAGKFFWEDIALKLEKIYWKMVKNA